MSFIVAGLGNPGEEYAVTRHNTGRMVVKRWQKSFHSRI
jgi:peptidyl-tRNA hydrolase